MKKKTRFEILLDLIKNLLLTNVYANYMLVVTLCVLVYLILHDNSNLVSILQHTDKIHNGN